MQVIHNRETKSRIARNTLFLYIRMGVIMLVTLYTSREILSILGVEDFGIYNVVSGVVVLFSFLNSAMTNASQRYLSIAVASNDSDNVQEVFSTSLILHLLLSLFVLLLSETAGLWFVKNYISLPSGKEIVGLQVYHLAVIISCVSILRVPYNAVIISNEKMSFYAYISILEAFLKLIVVWMLLLVKDNRLIAYARLLLAVNLFIYFIFIIYCFYKYKLSFKLKFYNSLFREFSVFSAWNIFGGVADVGYQQGTNMIINVFYGVTVNAAVGVMNQVRTAVYSFVYNLQLAANPQIIKSYSNHEFSYFHSLISLVSRMSYYLMLLLAVPILMNIDYILQLWLTVVPPYTPVFCKLILIFCLLDSLSGPLWVSMQATGKIKWYQICTCCCMLLNLPLSYVVLRSGLPVYSVYVIQILVCLLTLAVRLIFANYNISMTFSYYLKNVIFPLLLVTIASTILPVFMARSFNGLTKLLVTFSVNTITLSISIYLFGITTAERSKINSFLQKKIA